MEKFKNSQCVHVQKYLTSLLHYVYLNALVHKFWIISTRSQFCLNQRLSKQRLNLDLARHGSGNSASPGCHGKDPCHFPEGQDMPGHAGFTPAWSDHQATDPDLELRTHWVAWGRQTREMPGRFSVFAVSTGNLRHFDKTFHWATHYARATKRRSAKQVSVLMHMPGHFSGFPFFLAYQPQPFSIFLECSQIPFNTSSLSIQWKNHEHEQKKKWKT